MQDPKLKFYQASFLDDMRQMGDPPADALIQKLFAEGQAQEIHRLFKSLNTNQDLSIEALPSLLQAFIEEEVFAQAPGDPVKMRQGAHFFSQHADPLMTMLGFLSLPYCYAAADGAQVLFFSERLSQDTRRRLLETGQFVLDIMHPQAFEPEGKGYASILKVRLMHATVRYHLLKSGRWNLDWGHPINQEDMGGTNGAFSWICVRGLRKMGFSLASEDLEAYLHLWKIIGLRMGLREELLPDTPKEAFWLDKKISQRHFKASEAGQSLTKSLREVLMEGSQRPLPAGFVDSYLRYLLGDKVADILGVPAANWTQNLMGFLKLQNLVSRPSSELKGDIYQEIEKEIAQNPVHFAFPLEFN